MPKLFADDDIKERYKKVLDAAMPHLQGYDEIIIVSEKNFRDHEKRNEDRPSRTTEYKEPENDLDKNNAQIFTKMIENGDLGQAQSLYNHFASYVSSRSYIGPCAISVETKSKSGEGDPPYRAGFVFLPDFDPKILMKDVLSRDSKLFSDPRADVITNNFVLAHELGHLKDHVERGIPDPLVSPPGGYNSPEWLSRKHFGEIAADGFGAKIIRGLGDEQGLPPDHVLNNIFDSRTVSGAMSLLRTTPDVHFTTPFMDGAPLVGMPFSEVIGAGKSLLGVAQRDVIMPRFHSALDEMKINTPFPAMTDDESCLYQAKIYHDIGMGEYYNIPPAQRDFGDLQRPSIYDKFEECVLESTQRKREILDQIKEKFLPESGEGQILGQYSNAMERAKVSAFHENAEDIEKPRTPKLDGIAPPHTLSTPQVSVTP